MKLRLSKEHGGVLLIVLITGGIIGLTLGSYLQYTGTQTRSVMHSQAWNAAIPVAEAGVEEAMAHINSSVIGTNFAVNGWTVVSNQFQRSDTINGGGRYTVRISRETFPTITSVGYTSDRRQTNNLSRTVQVTTTRYATGMKGLVAKGNVVMNGTTVMDSFDSEDPRYSTLGRYDAAKHKDGGYAASVNGNVTAQTVYGSVATGPNGTATGNVGDFAWLASNTGIQPGKYANDVNLAFPEVQAPWSGGALPLPAAGMMITLTNFAYWSTMITTTNIPTSPPPASPVTTNYSGSHTIAYPGYPTGVPANLIRTNTLEVVEKKNLDVPEEGSYIGTIVEKAQYRYYTAITGYTYPTVTYSYSMTATNSSVVTQYYDKVLIADRYETTDLRMTSGKILVLGTNVNLYIKGTFYMGGNAELIIAPGASLRVYLGGPMEMAGSGIFNYTLDASKSQLFGLPGCTSLEISGNASYTGVIYAPNAAIALNGGGSNTYDVLGAIIGKTAELNGHFQFHYDEALGRARIQSKYNVASWREL
jgi:hypothetical protein